MGPEETEQNRRDKTRPKAAASKSSQFHILADVLKKKSAEKSKFWWENSETFSDLVWTRVENHGTYAELQKTFSKLLANGNTLSIMLMIALYETCSRLQLLSDISPRIVNISKLTHMESFCLLQLVVDYILFSAHSYVSVQIHLWHNNYQSTKILIHKEIA